MGGADRLMINTLKLMVGNSKYYYKKVDNITIPRL